MTCTPKLGFISTLTSPTTAWNPFTRNLTLGSQGSDVTALQNILISQSYLGAGYDTGYFGHLTEGALVKFQLAHGISPASGYYGSKTRAYIADMERSTVAPPTSASAPIIVPVSTSTTPSTAFTRDLTLGSTGSDVLALQQYLNTHGYVITTTGPGSPGNESDYFGPKTQSALAKFQKTNGIKPALGYFGPITRTYIANHQ